jgi:hypothetical protein
LTLAIKYASEEHPKKSGALTRLLLEIKKVQRLDVSPLKRLFQAFCERGKHNFNKVTTLMRATPR